MTELYFMLIVAVTWFFAEMLCSFPLGFTALLLQIFAIAVVLLLNATNSQVLSYHWKRFVLCLTLPAVDITADFSHTTLFQNNSKSHISRFSGCSINSRYSF